MVKKLWIMLSFINSYCIADISIQPLTKINMTQANGRKIAIKIEPSFSSEKFAEGQSGPRLLIPLFNSTRLLAFKPLITINSIWFDKLNGKNKRRDRKRL